MFRASAAFHAGSSTAELDAGNVFAGDEAEILVTGKLRNIAEERAFQKNSCRAEDWRRLVWGTRGRKTSSASVCIHRECLSAAPASDTANDARKVIIRMNIKPAMIPDSGETLPNHIGRRMNRRAAR